MAEKNIFNKVKAFAGPAMRGLGAQFAPAIAKGFLVDQLVGVPTKELIRYVEEDIPLWGLMKPEDQDKMIDLLGRVGQIDWLTADWVVAALREELPAAASLFLGWPEARSWLERQVQEIHQQLKN